MDTLRNAYIADNYTVRKVDTAGRSPPSPAPEPASLATEARRTKALLSGPNGLAVDANGNVYIAHHPRSLPSDQMS